MQLNLLDWGIVILSLLVCFAPALWYMRRAGSSSDEFFGSGRSAPWWLIGTSMVATTFSTDTPNLVTDFVRTGGVAKNWSWWAFLLTGMMTVFFYARLWRRSGVLTDLEFYELRYEGKPAAMLRGFRALYLGLFFNCIIMASVTLAAVKIGNLLLGWPTWKTVAWCAGISIVFSSMSGLWGVLVTDMIQFAIAMVGVSAAAWYALDHEKVGGLAGLIAQTPPETLAMIPNLASPGSGPAWDTLVAIFILPIAVQWWSVWYPGAEPGGGSYIAQRMLAAKSENDALAGTLWFNVAHYALRPWPWILVALASMIVFPTLKDIQTAFPNLDPKLIGHDIAYPAMLTLLPNGFRGLIVAALLAAYVSTMTTHLNWGSSYLIHDFWRRFIDPKATDASCIRNSRILTVILTALAMGTLSMLDTAKSAFDLMLSIGAGTGLLYILRWFWWRVNPWSEIVGMVASFIVAVTLLLARRSDMGFVSDVAKSDTWSLLVSVGVTTVAWVVATFVTRPTSDAQLLVFYKKVTPAGPGWTRIRAMAGGLMSPDSPATMILGWTSGIALVYAGLFGTGFVIYGKTFEATVCAGIFLVAAVGTVRALKSLRTEGNAT